MKKQKVTLEEAMKKFVVFTDVQQIVIKGGDGTGDTGGDDEEDTPEI